jgi:hypothetical protein
MIRRCAAPSVGAGGLIPKGYIYKGRLVASAAVPNI